MATTTTQPLALPDPAKADYRFHIANLREAIDFLEIAEPVEVKLTAGIQRHGAHRYVNGTHVITISAYLTPAGASATLWHELTHAAQSEYLGRTEFRAQYDGESRRHGYRGNRFEIEANEIAAAYSTDLPLTKPAN